MTVLARLVERFSAEQPFKGKRVLVCTHAKSETLGLLIAIRQLGGDVVYCPVTHSADGEVVARIGAAGFLVLSEDQAINEMGTVHLLAEDGARISRLLPVDAALLPDLLVIEQTTSGVRFHERTGQMRYPVINVAETELKRRIENSIATPEAVMAALSRRLQSSLFGKSVVIYGFGAIGEGLANTMRAHGACVSVVEANRVKLLVAKATGFAARAVDEAADLLAGADIVVSATDRRDGASIGVDEILLVKDGCRLLNAGSGFGEFAAEIREEGVRSAHRGTMVIAEAPDGLEISMSKAGNTKSCIILCGGRSINLHGHGGTPPEAIQMVFGLIVASAAFHRDHELPTTLIRVPSYVEELVARCWEESGASPVPSHILPDQLVTGERPFGTVTPISVNGSIGKNYSVAQAEFQPGSSTVGHFHARSEETYIVVKGEATIKVWDPRDRTSEWLYEVRTGDFLHVPSGLAHQVVTVSGCTFLIIASPPFSFWDQFFPNE